jgi:hypothetical protein
MAVLLKTSRSQVDRILDPKRDITLSSLQRAAALVGQRVVIYSAKVWNPMSRKGCETWGTRQKAASKDGDPVGLIGKEWASRPCARSNDLAYATPKATAVNELPQCTCDREKRPHKSDHGESPRRPTIRWLWH